MRFLATISGVALVFFSLAAFNKAPVLVRSQGEGRAPVIQGDKVTAFRVALKNAFLSSLGKEVDLLMSNPEDVRAFKQMVGDQVESFVVKYRILGMECIDVDNDAEAETDISGSAAEQPAVFVVKVETYIDSTYLQERVREYNSWR